MLRGSNIELNAFDSIDFLSDQAFVAETSDNELIQLVTQPGFIDLTQEQGGAERQDQGATPSEIVLRNGTPPITPSSRNNDVVISNADAIDLTSDEDLQGDDYEPPAKKRIIGVVTPMRIHIPSVNDERQTSASVLRWSDSQLNAWDQASWASEDDAPTRGGQTPYPSQEEPVEQDQEPAHEHTHEQEQDQEDQEEEGEDGNVSVASSNSSSRGHQRSERIEATLNHTLTEVLAIHTRMDGIETRLDDIIRLLNEQMTMNERGFGCVLSNGNENLREKRLMVDLLCATHRGVQEIRHFHN
ncbi:uncharacterized protein LOC125247881 isoform X1 [Megalobrama amblycephala]|uniref:uncharacterized protein LOC125247881 isoform X1 n=1 Tax=Megalobrama amblycephala TaxID=75352 RepID=UPI002013CF0E|nr:uncharacterized protein LOC125247881 isoform X1 [Megalobrama amblycephala]